jgi:hypothetical protein
MEIFNYEKLNGTEINEAIRLKSEIDLLSVWMIK